MFVVKAVVKDIADKTLHSREIRTLHQKFGISGFHNKIMTLIFIYKATNITLVPFVFSFFFSIFDVWCVTSHVTSFLYRGYGCKCTIPEQKFL